MTFTPHASYLPNDPLPNDPEHAQILSETATCQHHLHAKSVIELLIYYFFPRYKQINLKETGKMWMGSSNVNMYSTPK